MALTIADQRVVLGDIKVEYIVVDDSAGGAAPGSVTSQLVNPTVASIAAAGDSTAAMDASCAVTAGTKTIVLFDTKAIRYVITVLGF